MVIDNAQRWGIGMVGEPDRVSRAHMGHIGDQALEPTRPPTVDLVISLRKEQGEYFRPFHKQCEISDLYYTGRNQIPVPREMAIDPIRPATAHALINVAADHVDVNNPTFFVPEPSPRAKDRAERIKKFYQGAWMQISSAVKRTAVRHSIAYDIGFMKVTFADDLWPDVPLLGNFNSEEEWKEALKEHQERRNIVFPIRVINVNPKNVIWDDSRTGMKWTIETHKATVRALKAKYPEWTTSKSANEIATWTEYWDEKWYMFLADDVPVMGPHEHGYGFNPFVPIIPATQMDHEEGLPQDRYKGLLQPVISLLDAEARIITQLEAIMRQYAWPTIDFAGNRAEVENVMNAYEIFASKNNVGRVEVKASDRPMPPQELFAQLTLVQTMIEEATFPNVVRGIRPRGVSTGFGVSVLAGMGRLVFGSYADGMARAMSEVNKRFAMLVESPKIGRITVRARSQTHSFDQTITADDIKGFYENIVILKAEAPEEREREAILAERLWAKGQGMISLFEAQRRAGITNPLEEQNQMKAEQLVQGLFPEQLEAARTGINLPAQLARSVDAPVPENRGNEFAPNQAQLQRPGERNIQAARVASNQGRPSVFPQGSGGIALLGRQLGGATGGAVGVPSGQTVR